MFIQMLCSDILDFPPHMFENDNDETSEPKNLVEILELPRYISPEARSCVFGLLENDPDKRLGSPNSPHGQIRDHAFFKAGRPPIDWSAVDEGVFKSLHKNPIVKQTNDLVNIFLDFCFSSSRLLHLFYLISRFIKLFLL